MNDDAPVQVQYTPSTINKASPKRIFCGKAKIENARFETRLLRTYIIISPTTQGGVPKIGTLFFSREKNYRNPKIKPLEIYAKTRYFHLKQPVVAKSRCSVRAFNERRWKIGAFLSEMGGYIFSVPIFGTLVTVT